MELDASKTIRKLSTFEVYWLVSNWVAENEGSIVPWSLVAHPAKNRNANSTHKLLTKNLESIFSPFGYQKVMLVNNK